MAEILEVVLLTTEEEDEEEIITKPEVAKRHPEEAITTMAEVDKVKPNLHRPNLREGDSMAKEVVTTHQQTNPMEDKSQANGVQIAENQHTTQHNAGQRKRLILFEEDQQNQQQEQNEERDREIDNVGGFYATKN